MNLRLEIALGDNFPIHGRVRAEGGAREVLVRPKQEEDVVVQGYAHFRGENSRRGACKNSIHGAFKLNL